MRMNVNGREVDVPAASGDQRLVRFLRETCGLTGVKTACEVGMCGSCTVLIDDEPARACVKRLKDCEGHRILTIEGLAGPGGALHPLQQAFVDAGAIQCGFCTPGMVLAAHALLIKNPRPSREQIRRALQKNLCRCTGYQQIVDAVEQAALRYRENT